MEYAERAPKVPENWPDTDVEELFVSPPEPDASLGAVRRKLKPYADNKWLEGLPKVYPVYGIGGTVVFNRPECNLKILKDIDLTLVHQVCPKLFGEFQYLGETFLLTVQLHPVAAFVGLLYFITWGTYKTDFSLKSLPQPALFSLPIRIYHLGEIYELEELRRQAKFALTHNVELSCSSATASADLCESIRYLYSNLRESSELREIIAHYVVDCFCRHRLNQDEAFKQTVFECPLFHRDLLRANSVSEFAAQGAGDIIRLEVCRNKIHTDLTGGADFTCEFHENTTERVALLPSNCSFAEVRLPATTICGLRPLLSSFTDIAKVRQTTQVQPHIRRSEIPLDLRQEHSEPPAIQGDFEPISGSSIWKSHKEGTVLQHGFLQEVLTRVPDALSRPSARSQPEVDRTMESPKKKQKQAHGSSGSQSDGYGSFEEVEASESETESEWSVVTPTNRSPVLRAMQPIPCNDTLSLDTNDDSSIGHVSDLDTPLRSMSPLQPQEPISSSASSVSDPDIEYRLINGQNDDVDLALATALNHYVQNDEEEFEVSVQKAIEASYKQMKQDMRTENKERPAQAPQWPFPLENSSETGPRAVSYSDTEEETFSPQQVTDLQTSLKVLEEKMVHMKNRTGEWSMNKRASSPTAKFEERSMVENDIKRRTGMSKWREQGRLIHALAQTRKPADAPESSRDAANRATANKLAEWSDEEDHTAIPFRQTSQTNRLPLRPSTSKVTVWSQASTLNAEQLPLRTRSSRSGDGARGSLRDLTGLRISSGEAPASVAAAASSSTLVVKQEDDEWDEASVLFNQNDGLELDIGADADAEQATDDDTDSSWSDVESVMNDTPGRRRVLG